MQVTDAMVYAAKKQMTAAWGEEHIRAALKAALDECSVDEEGAHGLTDATGSTGYIQINYPTDPGSWSHDEIPAFVAVDDLVGMGEIADHFGIPKSDVVRWVQKRADNHFPRPIKQLKAGPVFHLVAVQAWHQAQEDAAGDG